MLRLLVGLGALCLSTATDTADVIVVGAGAAGSVAAARLAEELPEGRKVMLLEAGQPSLLESGGTHPPDLGVWESKRIGSGELTCFDVPGNYEAIAWKQFQWDEVPWTYQGKVLGGGTVVNGMLVRRPAREDFVREAGWPATGWDYDTDLVPAFKAVESTMHLTTTPSSDRRHYAGGSARLLRAALTAGGASMIPEGQYDADLWPPDDGPRMDPNRSAWCGWPVVAARNGTRDGPVRGYIIPATQRPNFILKTGATVERLVMNTPGEVTHVEYIQNGSSRRTVKLRSGGALVLAAGALLTPRLLLRSGIASDLPQDSCGTAYASTSRPLLLPGSAPRVGKSLHDHVLLEIIVSAPDFHWVDGLGKRHIGVPAWDPSNVTANLEDALQYESNRTGRYARYAPTQMGMMTSPLANSSNKGRAVGDEPDVEIFVNPHAFLPGKYGSEVDAATTFGMYVSLMRPQSRGKLELVTKIDSNGGSSRCGDLAQPTDLYLSTTTDVEAIAWATERMIDLVKQVGGIVHVPPAGSQSGPSLREWIRSDSMHSRLTMSHFGGSCSFDGCVGSDLKVIGTTNLFVGDLSVLPSPLSTHPVGTAMMIGERVVGFVCKYLRRSEVPSKAKADGMHIGWSIFFGSVVVVVICMATIAALRRRPKRQELFRQSLLGAPDANLRL